MATEGRGGESRAAARVRAVVRPEVQALAAYPVPSAAGLIKLDAMENPYPWPEAMRAEWARLAGQVAVNRYPDAGAGELKARLREALELPAEAALVLGNGSDELIQMVAMAVATAGATMLVPEPSFVMYRHAALATGMDYREVALDAESFALPRAAMLEAIERHRPALIFLAYPNNPTGNLWARPTIEAVIEAAPGLVVLDEAYAPFAHRSFVGQLHRYPNLVVLRTVSKLGLAGLRLGVLAAPAPWAEALERLRLPYNINALTQACAIFALGRAELFAAQAERIRAERERLIGRLERIAGLRVWPSEANFVLVRTLARPAAEVHAGLLEAGILVKNLHGASPALANCLRLTVGLPEDSEALLGALERLCAGPRA